MVHAVDAPVAMIGVAYCAVWHYIVAYNFAVAVVAAVVEIVAAALYFVVYKNFVACWWIVVL